MCDSKEPHVCKVTVSSVTQTLDEMDWERGIWYAALLGDNKRLSDLLESDGSARATDNFGYTALHYAARNGHLDICQMLVQHGALVDAQTKNGKATPMHRAAASGKTEVVKFLLKSGASVEIQDADGQTALHKAVQSGHLDIAALLQEAAPLIKHLKDLNGRTAYDFLLLKQHK